LQGRTQKIDTTRARGETPANEPEQLGKYEIAERIGEGGFGIVYKGFDPFIKRHVAIKTCTSPDKDLRQRYFHEAEIAGRLDHPNIVRIFDFGIEDDTPYLVQEFLAGGDLDHKIEGREFVPYPERLLYLIHIARGLEYAHEQGVIHRDIKPANIRILEDGTAKIMDFGVAKLQHTDTGLTKEGMAVGTAAYLAPEQISGDDTDQRTDIFSYGVLAYELLTGIRPFEQETISATLFSILNDDPSPISLPAQICPESMRQLIARCMEKDREDRFSNFAEVLQGLDRIRREMKVKSGERDLSNELRRVTPTTATAASAMSSQSFDPPIRHEWTPPSIRLRRRRRWKAAVVPLALVALAATAYGVLAYQGLVPWPELFSQALDQPSEMLPPHAAVTPTAISEPQVAAPETAEPETNDLADEPLPELEPEPPPPVIEDATLTLAKGWHNGMTVAVNGGEPMRLSRAQSLELPPGDYSLDFTLVTSDYRAIDSVRVTLGSGEEKTIRSPIARPGELSVQASLGSPQGLVRINGTTLGSSPVRAHKLAPGRHRLRVYAIHEPTLPLADTSVDIRSSRETVITFDLTGQRDLAVRYRNPSE